MRARLTKETEQQLPLLNEPGEARRRAHAVVYLQERSIFVHLEEGKTTVLGRSSDVDVVLDTSTVSRRHAAITWSEGRLTVADCGSTNGSFINDQQLIGEATLLGGEEIRLGDALVVVGLTSPRPLGRKFLPRAAFQQRLSQELIRASRLSRPLVLLHVTCLGGEEEVKTHLDALTSTLPGNVTAGTVRESEFNVVLPDATAESTRQTLAGLATSDRWNPTRVRIGVAEFPHHGQDLAALTAHAELEARGTDRPPAIPAEARKGPVAVDPVTVRLFALADRVAGAESTTLLVGETGVGKDVVAREIHSRSPRRDGPFVAVNCGAIPSTLFARELFGHEAGAFTGASDQQIGLFEASSGGTLFLDEVAEIPLAEQARLLRAIEHRAFTRIGGVQEISVDVRFVSATNRDLEDLVTQGLFREDLLFRLNVITIFVPALRDRPADINPLAQRFFKEVITSSGRGESSLVLSEEALGVLSRYSWPGNVRELRNAVERAVLLSSGPILTAEEILEILYGSSLTKTELSCETDLKVLVEEVERNVVRRALDSCGQNQSLAAQRLGISRRTLIYKMQRYGIAGRRSGE